MSEEWGPWIEHDGKGCPCVGQIVKVFCRDGREKGPFIAGADAITGLRSLDASWPTWLHIQHPLHRSRNWIIRYRIRRPKGMAILLTNLATIPTDLDTDVPVEVLNPELAE